MESLLMERTINDVNPPPDSRINRPLILSQEMIDGLFHGQIRDQLLDDQGRSRDGIEMPDSLQMFFDIATIVCDAGGRDHRIAQDLETDLPTEIVRDLAATTTFVHLQGKRREQ